MKNYKILSPNYDPKKRLKKKYQCFFEEKVGLFEEKLISSTL